jgi:hypothetical protein
MDTNELFEYASDKGICYGQVMIYLFNIKC